VKFKAAHAWLALVALVALSPTALSFALEAAGHPPKLEPPRTAVVVGPVSSEDPFPPAPGCELAWRSEISAGWCRPKLEARACPDGWAYAVARESRPGGSCLVTVEYFPPCHPDALWACPSAGAAPDGR